MSSWSARRRTYFLAIVVGFFALVSIALYYLFFWKAASCVDGILNQSELDVDCGGPCEKVCAIEVSPLIKDWARALKTTEGKYDVAALIENPNFNLGIKKLNYVFRLYDSDNTFLTEKAGDTFVNARDKFVIFAGNLDTGKRIPAKAIVEFDPKTTWSRVDPKKSKPPIIVQNPNFTNTPMPRLTAEMINDSIFDLTDITVTTVIYDEENNAIAVSQTFLNSLKRGLTENIAFTWPVPFSLAQPAKEIYARVDLVNRVR